MMGIRRDLKNYIDNKIIPQYRGLDAAHGPEHIKQVISRSLYLAEKTGADREMVYVIAAYHDIGMKRSRKNHGFFSAQILKADKCLFKWFTKDQRRVMAQAVEYHSTSLKAEQVSIYGKIIYQADKTLDAETILKRAVQFGMTYYSGYSFERQVERVYQYVNKKYGEDGLFRFWIDLPEERTRLQKLQKSIKDKSYVRDICQKYYWPCEEKKA